MIPMFLFGSKNSSLSTILFSWKSFTTRSQSLPKVSDASIRMMRLRKNLLCANLANDRTKQINHLLLNDPDLLNFVACSPMLPVFHQGKALSALARLKQRIVGPGKLSSPGYSFRESGFVEYIVVGKCGGERQVIGGIWPASDELEVHIRSFRLLS